MVSPEMITGRPGRSYCSIKSASAAHGAVAASHPAQNAGRNQQQQAHPRAAGRAHEPRM